MPEIKLARLPDRTPIKLAIIVTPDLKAALDEYAAAYEAAYGVSEPVCDLIPYMLQFFLENDRGFARSRTKG